MSQDRYFIVAFISIIITMAFGFSAIRFKAHREALDLPGSDQTEYSVPKEVHGIKVLEIEPETFVSEVTAYCPGSCCCGEFADGITASGHVIEEGDMFVAADKSIPFSTILDIPGYGEVPVLDRGGAIKGKRLDVFFYSHQEALEWGSQKGLTITIKKGN